MELSTAAQVAKQAQESARLDADPGESTALLAEAVGKLAEAMDIRLGDLERAIRALESRIRHLG